MPPPGLLRLGGTLEAAGFEVALEDLAYRLGAGDVHGDERLAESCADWLLARGDHGVIGFSTMGATLPASVAIAQLIRERAPEIRLVFGGPGTTGVDEALLERFDWIDAIVRGEGEVSVPALLARWGGAEEAAGVAGVTWRRSDGSVQREEDQQQLKSLEELAPYARHLLPPLVDYKKITGEDDGLTPIDSGRGCAYDCSFCTIGRFWSRRSRTLPAARLADEVCALLELEGARNAYLCHDLFGADKAQAMEFCEEMIERGSPFPWEVRARLDHLDDELLEAMGRAGGYRVLFGVESADAGVLEACDKNTRAGWDPMRAVESCAANGITPILSLVLGLPGEGDDELAASLDLCSRAALTAGVNISLHLVNPQPGCGLGEEFAAAARPLDGVPPDMALGAGTTAPERALIEAHPDLFSSFALLPQPEERLRELALISHTLPDVFLSTPRSFAYLRSAQEMSSLELFRSWMQRGGSWDEFVQGSGDLVAAELLAWDRAAALVSATKYEETSGGLLPRPTAELVKVTHDLPGLTEGLERGECEPLPMELTLAVHRTSGGVVTTHIDQEVADLLEVLRSNPGPVPEELRPALDTLESAGLIRYT